MLVPVTIYSVPMSRRITIAICATLIRVVPPQVALGTMAATVPMALAALVLPAQDIWLELSGLPSTEAMVPMALTVLVVEAVVRVPVVNLMDVAVRTVVPVVAVAAQVAVLVLAVNWERVAVLLLVWFTSVPLTVPLYRFL